VVQYFPSRDYLLGAAATVLTLRAMSRRWATGEALDQNVQTHAAADSANRTPANEVSEHRCRKICLRSV
jgi:hypothetical protein